MNNTFLDLNLIKTAVNLSPDKMKFVNAITDCIFSAEEDFSNKKKYLLDEYNKIQLNALIKKEILN